MLSNCVYTTHSGTIGITLIEKKEEVIPLVDGRRWKEHFEKLYKKGNINSEQKALNSQLRKRQAKSIRCHYNITRIEYKIEIPQEQKMMWCR